MKVCFQADADLNQVILLAAVRRKPAMDFQTALAAGLLGAADRDVLATVAKDGRVLVTHDRRTMPRHFLDFVTLEPSAGVIVIPQSLSVAKAVEDLILIWSATEAEEWVNRIAFLPL